MGRRSHGKKKSSPIIASPREQEAALQVVTFSIQAELVRERLMLRRVGWKGEQTYADETSSDNMGGFILGKGNVRKHMWMADEGGVGVAVDVGLPLPACGIRVASADVFRLEAFEFLLGAKFVGLSRGDC